MEELLSKELIGLESDKKVTKAVLDSEREKFAKSLKDGMGKEIIEILERKEEELRLKEEKKKNEEEKAKRSVLKRISKKITAAIDGVLKYF